MNNELALQPIWEFCIKHLGDFLSSPALILTAVILGVYVPGIVFSIIDVFISKRLSLKEFFAVYWRAMKWYSTIYVAAIIFFVLVPLPIKLNVPASAPTLTEFFRDLVFYFLLGDFASYVWHRVEHANKWYAKKVHYYHHIDHPPLTIWTAMVVHPVEGFSVFLCFHIYGILFPIHPLTFAVAAFSITAVTMITHCGYRIPVYDKLFANAACHNLHHANRAPTNVSVVLTLCDRLFGTYQKA
ncbi:MAG: sterol desaturase family protein [Halioglobus sp.]